MLWHGGDIEIVLVSHCLGVLLARDPYVKEETTNLKVTTNDEQVDSIPAFLFACLVNGSVDGMQCTMALMKVSLLAFQQILH